MKPRQSPFNLPTKRLDFKRILNSRRNVDPNVMKDFKGVFKCSPMPFFTGYNTAFTGSLLSYLLLLPAGKYSFICSHCASVKSLVYLIPFILSYFSMLTSSQTKHQLRKLLPQCHHSLTAITKNIIINLPTILKNAPLY